MTTSHPLLEKIPKSPRIFAIFHAIEPELSLETDAGHDLSHVVRVATWTERLGKPLNVPQDWAWAAGLMHDIVNVPKNSPLRSKASEMCAEKADEILKKQGHWSGDERLQIFAAIRDHSYSRGATPEHALGKALQDADRLEALGSIGIMRTFSTGVRMGTRYFDPMDPWAENRPLDDLRFSVDHFFNKLLKLPATFQTDPGKVEAKKRAESLERFLEDLKNELA